MKYFHSALLMIGVAGGVSLCSTGEEDYSGKYAGKLSVSEFDCDQAIEPKPFQLKFEVFQEDSQVIVDFSDFENFTLVGEVNDEGFIATETSDDGAVLTLIATDVDSDSAEILFGFDTEDCNMAFTGKFQRLR